MKVKKILIIKLGAMGDVLRTTSILEGLKVKYPGAVIWWLTRKESLDILKNNKLADKVFVLEDSKNLMKVEFDLVISLDDDTEAAKLSSLLKKKELIGSYMEDNKVLYTDSSASWFDMGLISRYGKERADELKRLNKETYQQILAEILGIKRGNIILELGKENLGFAADFAERNNIKKRDIIVGLNTGSGRRWKLKQLTIEKTAELANKLIKELNAEVILFGGPKEAERNKRIRDKAKGIIDAGCNNSLLDFAALIDLCDLVVCSDSLAMHIAIALKKKVVAFFGPTSAAEIELYGLGKKIIPRMECYCCYKKECDKKPSCIDVITVEEIFEAAKELLGKAKAR